MKRLETWKASIRYFLIIVLLFPSASFGAQEESTQRYYSRFFDNEYHDTTATNERLQWEKTIWQEAMWAEAIPEIKFMPIDTSLSVADWVSIGVLGFVAAALLCAPLLLN
ncbi:MAG: hypothetical protein WCG05_00070 [Alphaproteobacteria bacterium]